MMTTTRSFTFQAVFCVLVVFVHQAKLEEELPSTAVPKLIGDDYNQTVDEGGDFRLECKYDDEGSKATVMWRKNQSYISLGLHSMLSKHDPLVDRLEVLSDQSLKVVNAVREDAGVYTCELGVMAESKLQQNHRVNVKYPAKITKLEPRNGLNAPEGRDVKLQCESEGFPEPKITWTLKDMPVSHAEVQDGGRTLYIPNIKSDHGGEYKCISDNGVKEPDEQGIMVSVLFPPVVETFPEEEYVPVLLDGSVTLKCTVVNANPTPTITWYFNGTEMPSKTTEEITIEKMKHSDAGIYTCQVTNRIGANIEKSFTLSVIYNEHQNEPPSESSRGTTHFHLHLASLLTMFVTISSIFW